MATVKKVPLEKSQLQKGEVESIVGVSGKTYAVGQKLYWDKKATEENKPFAVVDSIECEMAMGMPYANIWVRDKKTKELTYIYSVYGVAFITYKTQPARIEEDVKEV